MMTATLSVAGRSVRKFIRTPQLIVIGAVQTIMFLLIFRYVFGGAIRTGEVPYVDYLIPGFLATSVIFSGTSAAAGMAEDVEGGFLDRLRSLPVARSSILAGRALAETALISYGLVLTAAVGFLVGFRLHGTAVEALAALVLCFLFGFAFIWLFMTIGLVAGNAQAAQGMSLLVFPLTFVSSTYVPVDTMPGWMQPFAEHQPVTVMVNAVRSLSLGQADGSAISQALLWTAAIVAVFAPLAVARFQRA